MKRVNIKPVSPIHGAFNGPLVTPLRNFNATEDQIYRCLVGGAYVEEILQNGKKLKLNFDNYNKDNGGKLTIQKPIVNVKPQQPAETPALKVDPAGQPNKVEQKEPEHEQVEETTEENVEAEESNEEVTEDAEDSVEEPRTVTVGQPQQRQGGRPHNTKNKK